MLSHFMPSQTIIRRMSAGLDAVIVIPTGQPTLKFHRQKAAGVERDPE